MEDVLELLSFGGDGQDAYRAFNVEGVNEAHFTVFGVIFSEVGLVYPSIRQ